MRSKSRLIACVYFYFVCILSVKTLQFSSQQPTEKEHLSQIIMCTPVCAALGYLPQNEFDEEVARKDAEIAVLKQEIDGLGATNQAKQLAKQAAEKNAMVNKLISTVRGKALQSKRERLNSTKGKLTKAEDTLEAQEEQIAENEEQIASLKSEVQDMAQEIETLVKEMEKLNKLRVEEIQKTYDSYIGYLNTEKKSREQEVKEAQVALDKEMQALEQTTRKLEQTVADKSKHQALDNGEDVSVSDAGEFQAPGEEDEELDE